MASPPAFAAAGMMLRRTADDFASRLADTTAVVFMVLLALEIHHFTGGGRIDRMGVTLAEIGSTSPCCLLRISSSIFRKEMGAPAFAWAEVASRSLFSPMPLPPRRPANPSSPARSCRRTGLQPRTARPAVCPRWRLQFGNARRRRYVTTAVVAALVSASPMSSRTGPVPRLGVDRAQDHEREQYTYLPSGCCRHGVAPCRHFWAKSATLCASPAFVVGLTIVTVFKSSTWRTSLASSARCPSSASARY